MALERPRKLLEGRRRSGEGEEVGGEEEKPKKWNRGRASFKEVKQGGRKGVLGTPRHPTLAYQSVSGMLPCIG